VFVAGFESDEDFEDKTDGSPIMFWIGEKISQGTTLESLNSDGKLKVMFWEGGSQRNMLENKNPPIFNLQWLKV
jgi:hypothetical protein